MVTPASNGSPTIDGAAESFAGVLHPAADRIGRTLSKSDFKAARTCAAKLFFRENHYPDATQDEPYLRLLQRGGYMVEALAKARYADGVQLSYGSDVRTDFARTMHDLEKENVTLFEATLLVGRRLARVDILEKRGDRIRLIEVKSSVFDGVAHIESLASGKHGIFRTDRKPHGIRRDWLAYLEDVAFQLLLCDALFPSLSVEPWLALLDGSKRASIDDMPSLFELVESGDRLLTARYAGNCEQLASLDLITEVSVAAECELIRADVEAVARYFEARLDAPLEDFLSGLERGSKCTACEFRHDEPIEKDGFAACWGALAAPSPHALELYAIGNVKADDGKPMIASLFESGRTSLYDVPIHRLTTASGHIGAQAQRQRRQIEYTRRDEIFVDPALADAIATLGFPRHFIDFEAARLALPHHAGMRAYGLLAFQWSCHSAAPDGTLAQRGWLNTQERWPNLAFIETLRQALGDEGPVLTWTSFEATTLAHVARDLAMSGDDARDLIAWLNDVIERRVVDMHRWCTDWYFSPGMGGRTSIKVVLDAAWKCDAEMRRQFEVWTGLPADAATDPYASLPPIEIDGASRSVQEGTGAVLSYEEMVYGAGRRDPRQKAKWGALLEQYCALDTLSMVLIFEHWKRRLGIA